MSMARGATPLVKGVYTTYRELPCNYRSFLVPKPSKLILNVTAVCMYGKVEKSPERRTDITKVSV